MAIYTPDNEPYLGRKSLQTFDELIVTALDLNKSIAPITHSIKNKSTIQMAACQLIPAGISLTLSIRELVRQAYLYGALVLGRPLAERTMTIRYLFEFPEKQELWKNGWKHGERPSLARMINELGGEKWAGIGPIFTKSMNSLTHGDPDSAQWNVIELQDGLVGHPVSKMLDQPEVADKIAYESTCYLTILIAMSAAIFPVNEYGTSKLDGAKENE